MLILGVWSCDHTEPFAYTPPPPRGPFSSAIPRRLTFNPGDDRFPSVQGGLVAYSQRLSDRSDRDWCVAVLPDSGGELVHQLCPPGPVDTLVDAWRLPALSPDLARVVFWKEQGLITNAVPAVRSFEMVSFAQPDSQTDVLDAPYLLPDGSRGNAVRQVTWPTASTLRFLAGVELVNTAPTDTIFLPLGVAELDLASNTLTLVAGTAGAVSYANAPDGGVWFVQPGGTVVLHLAPGATTPDTVGTSPYPIDEIANANGIPVAIVELPVDSGPPTPVLASLTPGTFQVLYSAAVTDLAAGPGSPNIVTPVVRLGTGGAGANLWMVQAR